MFLFSRRKPSQLQALAGMTISVQSDIQDWTAEQRPPRDNTEQASQLHVMLQKISETLHTNEVVDALESAWRFIKDNPATEKLLLPTDIGLMTRALQISYGVVLAKKTERSQARTTRSDAVGQASAMLDTLGF